MTLDQHAAELRAETRVMAEAALRAIDARLGLTPQFSNRSIGQRRRWKAARAAKLLKEHV